ncbi:CybS [Cooperia oncophora]
MVPLFPAAYFIHGPVMDAVLTVALTLHIHWGVQGVVQDYARPFVIGDTLAKTARASVYLITAALLAGTLMFIERYFAAAMVPLFPAAYFIHGPVMDAVLTVALTLHIHWGVQGVVQDYARPFVIGDTLAKTARASVYLITAALLAGLLHFNTNDVGITEAFRMVFSL